MWTVVLFNKKAVLSQGWPRDAPTKANSQTSTYDHVTLGWLSSTGRYGRRCWTNISQISPCSPGNRWVTFGLRGSSEDVGLIVRSISFQDFQPTGCSKKTDPLVYFDDNFGKYGPILIIFSLLQQAIYNAQKLSYFSHLTFIMLPLYLAKRTLMLVSMRIFLDHAKKN